ncbi:hypothetical protein VKT23_008833 [Stygiomarasmius scandens]|uniref:Uncharacterized protein n=1 Tax=Marasmiellus scandens TaxID=2682957 RepID=A0ABR1JI26_9AGAR
MSYSYSASSSLFILTPASSPRETHETYEQLWQVLRPSTQQNRGDAFPQKKRSTFGWKKLFGKGF